MAVCPDSNGGTIAAPLPGRMREEEQEEEEEEEGQ